MTKYELYRGYLIETVPKRYEHGEDIYVYEPFAVAYLDGKNYPPLDFILTGVETVEEAENFIDVTLIATGLTQRGENCEQN